MTTILVTTLIIILLSVPFSLVILYVQFRHSPLGKWKTQVYRRIADLKNRGDQLRRKVDAPVQKQIDQLENEFVRQYFMTVALRGLIDYPGIGTATLDRLVSAGYNSLGQAVNMRFDSIPGIGPSRAHDLQVAVQSMMREARSRFNAGACPQAQAHQQKVNGLKEEIQNRAVARQREVVAVEAALKEARQLRSHADRVTFTAFLLRRPIDVSAEIVQKPLPEARVIVPSSPLAPIVKAIPPKPLASPTPTILAEKPIAHTSVLPQNKQKKGDPSPVKKQEDLFRAELNNQKQAPPQGKQEHPWLAKMRLIIQFALIVARADGRVAKAEHKLIRRFLEDKFGHVTALVPYIDPLLEKLSKVNLDEAMTLRLLCNCTQDDEKNELYQFAQRIIDSMGERNSKENQLLARIAASFRLISPTATVPVTQLTTKTEPQSAEIPPLTMNECRSLLEIDTSTRLNPDLIRRRHTLLNEKLDPAKLAGMGAEFVKMAEQKRKRLRDAAEFLISPFAVPLDVPASPVNHELRHNPDLDAVFGD